MKRASFVMRSVLALRALAVIIVMLTATTVWADDSGYCGDPDVHGGQDVSWSLTDEDGDNVKETLTISGMGAMVDYQYNQYAPWYNNSDIKTVVIENGVTSIGNCAFFECTNLTSVTIPSGVTIIGDHAFNSCSSLTSVVIPNGVTSIGEFAFYECTNLTSVVIPSSVESIGDGAFYDCTNLTSVTIPNKVTSIGESTFYNCTSLTSVVIPFSVTSIGKKAFENCTGLTSVIISEGVTTIEWDAFKDCTGLTSVTIPSSVTSIGDGIFFGCSSLETITVDQNNSKYDSRNGCNAIIEKESNTLLLGCKNTVIPNSVTSIGASAFDYCTDLTSITIPSNVTSIGWSAFEGCSSLTSINIPSSVTSIGDGIFFGCSSLETITVDQNNSKYDSRNGCNAIIEKESNTLFVGCKNTIIPNDVTSIGALAFSYCTSLTSVIIPSSVTTIGINAFYGCTGLTSVTIPSSVESIGWYAFKDCTNLTSVLILRSEQTTYSNDAFDGNASGRKIYVPNGKASDYKAVWSSYSNDIVEFDGYCGDNVVWVLTDEDGDVNNTKETLIITGTGEMKDYYEDDAPWDSNSDIETVVIENGVTSIGAITFIECKGLTSVTIPNSVTSIGEGAFNDCINLTSVTIPNGVTSIGINAFHYCEGLTSVDIPSSVTSIGDAAFTGCPALETITVDQNNTTYDSRNGCNAIIETENNTLLFGCKNTAIPNGVTSIMSGAFLDCKGLTSVTIPSSVTCIWRDTFYGCSNVTDMYCYTNPDNLIWDDGNCDDFIYDDKNPTKTTVCHVAGSKLATFLSKWCTGSTGPGGNDINVIFEGDGIEPGGVDYLVETVTYGSGTAPEGVKTFLPVAYDLSTATVTLAEVEGAPKGMPVIYGSAKVDEKMPDLFFLNYVADDSDDDKAIQDNYDSKAKAMSEHFVITDGKDNLFTILGDIDGVTASDAIFFVLANGKFTRVSVSADDLDKEANPAKPGLLLFILTKWEYLNMGSNESAEGSGNAGSRSIGIGDGGETTRIRPPLTPPTQEGKGCAQWYDMQGRRIEKPTRKGLYIRNGKVVVKY